MKQKKCYHDQLNELVTCYDAWVIFVPFRGWFLRFVEPLYFGDRGIFLGKNGQEALENVHKYEIKDVK